MLYPGLPHGLEQVEGSHHVVAEVLARLLHALTHVGVGGKVDNRLHPVLQSCKQRRRIQKIPLHQRPPLYRPPMPHAQVVEDHRRVPRLVQGFGRMAADVACSANHQDPHAHKRPSLK